MVKELGNLLCSHQEDHRTTKEEIRGERGCGDKDQGDPAMAVASTATG